MASDRVKVLFCGARSLGMQCLEMLANNPHVDLVGAVVPRKTEQVWWKDVVDEDFVNDLGVDLIDWKDAKELRGLDLVFSVLHGPIFKEPFISNVKCGVINLHPAGLPFYRGCNGYAHAIMNDDKAYGVSLHFVDEGIDTGHLIDEAWIPIKNDDTGWTLYKKAQTAARKVFARNLWPIIALAREGKKISSYPQGEEDAAYYPRTSLQNKEIGIRWDYHKLYNFVRALQFEPFEPAYYVLEGQKFHLKIDQYGIYVVENGYKMVA